MRHVIVESFGGPEQLNIIESPTPKPGLGQVLVKLTSIGLNQADLMGRRGEYKASTGGVPYTPGIEGGGVVDAVGEGVEAARVGQRVTLAPNCPRGVHGSHGGTYRSHVLIDATLVLPAPQAIPDKQLGAIWLPYLTAWGCLVWKAKIKPGDIVGLPAASSSVALAAAQVVKQQGGTAIGLTSSPDKAAAIRALPTAAYDELIITHDRDGDGNRVMRQWYREVKQLTGGHGVDVWFDPIAAGDYLSAEVRCLANGGAVYIYGLLGEPGVVNLQPLIIRRAKIDAFVLYELIDAGETTWRDACDQVFSLFDQGEFKQHLAGTYALDDVRESHAQMEKGTHVGKFVLIP